MNRLKRAIEVFHTTICNTFYLSQNIHKIKIFLTDELKSLHTKDVLISNI